MGDAEFRRNAGPGRFFGVKVDSSLRCQGLIASRICFLPVSPETAPG